MPTAIGKAADGDTVVVMSGTYSNLPNMGSGPGNITVQGQTPRPVLSFAGNDGGGLQLSGSLVNVELDNPAGANPAATVYGLIDRVLANGEAGCEIGGNGSVIRDSVCVGATGSGLFVTGGNGDALTVRNVTARGATAGVEVKGGCGCVMNTSTSATVVNTIARATGPGSPDLYAATYSGGSYTWTSSITVSNSNFATSVHETGSSITDGGHNQTAAPLFVNQGAEDFHQAPGSPTIDAGMNDPANGGTDLDGNTRTLGASTDIGAYEFVPGGGGGAGGGGSGGSGGGGSGGSNGGGGGSTTSSNFVLTHPGVSKTGVLTFVLNAPGPGTFTATATAILPGGKGADIARRRRKPKPKQISYGSATVTASNAGPVRLVIRPSGSAATALRKGQRLTVLVTITFIPATGTPTTHQTTVIVQGAKPKAKTHR